MTNAHLRRVVVIVSVKQTVCVFSLNYVLKPKKIWRSKPESPSTTLAEGILYLTLLEKSTDNTITRHLLEKYKKLYNSTFTDKYKPEKPQKERTIKHVFLHERNPKY